MRVAQRRGHLTVHLNAFFADAPEEVRDALASWLRSGRRARRATHTIDEWIERQVSALPARALDPDRDRARGRVHDLGALARELAAGELAPDFASREPPAVVWSRRARTRARRSLRLGTFDPVDRCVRIHPVLDQRAVPSYFVRYVVFHELLHAALEDEAGARRTAGGRRELHGREFRARERAFGDTARALAWERAHLDALFRSARTGQPITGDARGRAARGVARAPQFFLF